MVAHRDIDGLVIPVGSQADVEAGTADVDDVIFAVDSSGEIIGYSTDGGATWVWPAGGSAAEHRILLADGHATPFTFDDLLQMDDGSDFMWSD